MKGIFAAVAALIVLQGPVRAAEAPLNPIPEGSKGASFLQGSSEEKGLFGRYLDFMDKEIQRIDQMDLWGPGSTQLPKGYFSVKYQWNGRRADKRYDYYQHEIPILPPIRLAQDPDNFMELDMRGKGKGGAHSFMLSYGILGYLDYYVEIPFMYMDVSFNPKYTAKGTPIVLFGNTLEQFYQTIEKLGRPRPNTHFKSDWEFQDINTGFSFNFHRSEWLSASFTPKVYFPTGKVANPDNSIDFLRGPEMDRGTGGYTFAFVSDYDFRIPQFKRIMWTLEFSYSYALRHRRPAPHFNKPDWSDMDQKLNVAGLNPTEKTQVLDELKLYFPDMSNTGEYYYSTPGAAMDASLGMGFDLFVGTLSIGYGYHYKAKPVLESASPEFIAFVNNLQIVGEQEGEAISLVFNTPILFLAKIPATLQFRWDLPAGGRNFLKFEDNYFVQIQSFIPVNLPATPLEKVAAP